MCKGCKDCEGGIVSFNYYFQAEVCNFCGSMNYVSTEDQQKEREETLKKQKEWLNFYSLIKQKQTIVMQ